MVASAGVIAVVLNASWADRHRDAVTSFASGMLVTTAIMHLMPESLGISHWGALFILVGYLALSVSNWLVDRIATAGGDRRIAAVVPIVGVGFHSFVDGLEYTVLFAHELFTGLIATGGLIAHEFAEGVIVFAILRASGRGALISAIGALMLAAAATPIGAVVALEFFSPMSVNAIGWLMGFAAGALLYVGANHLPQQLRSKESAIHMPAFLIAVTIAAVLALLHASGEEMAH